MPALSHAVAVRPGVGRELFAHFKQRGDLALDHERHADELRASDLRLDELQQRINATDDLVAEHETRIDLTYRGLETVTLQIRNSAPHSTTSGATYRRWWPRAWSRRRATRSSGSPCARACGKARQRGRRDWVLKLVRVGLDRAFWAALFGFALLKVAGPGALIEWLTKGHWHEPLRTSPWPSSSSATQRRGEASTTILLPTYCTHSSAPRRAWRSVRRSPAALDHHFQRLPVPLRSMRPWAGSRRASTRAARRPTYRTAVR